MSSRPDDRVQPLAGYSPAVGTGLWQLEDTRARTLALVAHMRPEAIDWVSPWNGNTIGSLLYHVAAIELDYLYYDILQSEEYPDTVASLFPVEVREQGGKLTRVPNETLDRHLERLSYVRQLVRSTLSAMTDDDFRRPRATEQYDITPEWALHHLCQHEAEHRGQMGEILQAGGFSPDS